MGVGRAVEGLTVRAVRDGRAVGVDEALDGQVDLIDEEVVEGVVGREVDGLLDLALDAAQVGLLSAQNSLGHVRGSVGLQPLLRPTEIELEEAQREADGRARLGGLRRGRAELVDLDHVAVGGGAVLALTVGADFAQGRNHVGHDRIMRGDVSFENALDGVQAILRGARETSGEQGIDVVGAGGWGGHGTLS